MHKLIIIRHVPAEKARTCVAKFKARGWRIVKVDPLLQEVESIKVIVVEKKSCNE